MEVIKMTLQHSRWLVTGTLSLGGVLVAGAVAGGVLVASGQGAGGAHNAAGHQADTQQVALNEQLSAKSASGAQQSGEFPTNAAGMTYGTAGKASSPAQEPDLIAATATNGRDGYVRKSDLRRTATQDGPDYRMTREEAIKRAKAGTLPQPSGPGIPVYAKDGVTQIGWLGTAVSITLVNPK